MDDRTHEQLKAYNQGRQDARRAASDEIEELEDDLAESKSREKRLWALLLEFTKVNWERAGRTRAETRKMLKSRDLDALCRALGVEHE